MTQHDPPTTPPDDFSDLPFVEEVTSEETGQLVLTIEAYGTTAHDGSDRTEEGFNYYVSPLGGGKRHEYDDLVEACQSATMSLEAAGLLLRIMSLRIDSYFCRHH